MLSFLQSISFFVVLSSTSPCYCPCHLVRNVSLTPVELQKKIEKMKSELTIPTKKTNKYQRSLTSAPDNRPSARGLGSLGIVIIGIIVTMLIAFDFPRAARSAVNIAHKAKRKSRKQRTAWTNRQWLHLFFDGYISVARGISVLCTTKCRGSLDRLFLSTIGMVINRI